MKSGSTLAHYRIGALLGRGGMGDVYEATDTRLDRRVAIKVLASRYVADEQAKARFIQEAKAASSLDHPNICTIHDIGETDEGDLYIVMALYDGGTLVDLLEDGPLPVDRAVGIVRQVAEALQRAHASGIVHRDVKPANIMVSEGDRVRLLDFGIAKLQSSEALTATGTSIGTSGYMSPEQATGEPVTPASDVWSLGVMAWEMLAGRRPFQAETPLAMLHQVVSVDPPPLAEGRPDVPPRLAAVIHGALAREPADRFADAGEVLAALDEAMGRPSHGRSAAPVGGSSRWVWLGVALVIVAAVSGVVVTWLPGGESAGDAISRDVIAVLPFDVSGAGDLDYLSEGMVNLIGGRLDGAGSLRVVDPRAVLGRGGVEGGEPIDVARGAVLARELGAGRFITGDVTGLPGRVTISARLHETAGGEDHPLVTREGPADNLADLVDAVATELLASTLVGANARIQRGAALSSRSPEATKEFLRGEQFHRQGEFDSAAAAYNRALVHDSTFAFAHLMKSLNNAFTYETDDYVAAEKAWRFSGDLPERDRSLILAFYDQQSGRLDEAMQRFGTHLQRWPDEVKALIMAGMLVERSNPRWARPIEEARPYYARALELEPDNVQVLHKLARIDAGSRLYDSLPVRAAQLQRVAPDSEWAVDARTMAAFALGDTAAIEHLVETFPQQPLLVRLYAIYNAIRFGSDLEAAERMIARARTGTVNQATGLPTSFEIGDDLSIVLEVLTDLVGGRYDAVRAFLRDPPRSAVWYVWCAELVATDLVPLDPELTELVLQRVLAVDPEDRLRNPFEPLHDIFSVEVATLERDFAAALLLVRLGRLDEARAIHQRITRHPPYLAFESLREDAAGALEAELLLREGDREAALETLRSLSFQVPLTASSLAVTQGSHARYLRGRLEAEIGDPEAARLLFMGMVESFAPPDKMVLGDLYERLGRIHEDAGRTEQAIYYYDRFVRAWAGADEGQLPRRRTVEERLSRLRAEGTTP